MASTSDISLHEGATVVAGVLTFFRGAQDTALLCDLTGATALPQLKGKNALWAHIDGYSGMEDLALTFNLIS